MRIGSILLFSSLCVTAVAQSVTNRTSQYEIDLATSKSVNSTFPIVSWIAPNQDDETTFLHGNEYVVKFAVESTSAITNVTISIKPAPDAAPKVSQSIKFEP